MCAARLRSQIVVVAAAVLAAIGMGAAAASVPFNALILAFALLAVLIGAWLLGDVKRALVLLVGVIALLPRFASPVSIGFKPTFLDIALVGLLLAWSMAQRDGQRLYPLRFHKLRRAHDIDLHHVKARIACRQHGRQILALQL